MALSNFEEDPYLYRKSRNKKAESLLRSQLGMCALGNSNISLFLIFAKDYRSAVSIAFGVTNKSYQVGKFANTESSNKRESSACCPRGASKNL